MTDDKGCVHPISDKLPAQTYTVTRVAVETSPNDTGLVYMIMSLRSILNTIPPGFPMNLNPKEEAYIRGWFGRYDKDGDGEVSVVSFQLCSFSIPFFTLLPIAVDRGRAW